MKTMLKALVPLFVSASLVGCAPALYTSAGDEPVQVDTRTQEPEEPANVPPLPFNDNGYWAGDASPSFAEGEPGQVSVVQVGARLADQGIIPFAFRNNTEEAIGDVRWNVTARSGGSVVGSGISFDSTPGVVRPGEVALTNVYFDNLDSIPEDAELNFKVTAQSGGSAAHLLPVRVSEVNLVGESYVGTVVNELNQEVSAPSVNVFCFDGDQIVGELLGFIDIHELGAGETASFSVYNFSGYCPSFVAGANGTTW